MSIANLILYVHFAFVLGVVLPVPLILLGGIQGWEWIRNPWFRNFHLGMIGIVVAETLIGIACPLTVWEERLREAAGKGEGYGGSFIAYWVTRALYYNFPPWVFTTLYLSYGALIAFLYWRYPPRPRH